MYNNNIGRGMGFLAAADFMNQAAIPTEQRGPLLTAAVARAVGYCAALPAVAEEPASYYLANVEANVRAIVSKLNETVVLDTRKILAAVYGVWLLRYKLVHEPTTIEVREFLDSALRVGSRAVPPELSEAMTSLNTQHLDHMARLICTDWNTASEAPEDAS